MMHFRFEEIPYRISTKKIQVSNAKYNKYQNTKCYMRCRLMKTVNHKAYEEVTKPTKFICYIIALCGLCVNPLCTLWLNKVFKQAKHNQWGCRNKNSII